MGIMKKQEGFTIIEVSMVLAIVGVLAVTIISTLAGQGGWIT